MAARAVGALLAFGAAALFAVSLVTPKIWAEGPGWWDGHPTVDGKEIERKDAHIGLVGAVGCDTRGCQEIEVDSRFTNIAAVELSAIVLALAFAGMLAGATFKASDRKKTLAALSIGSTGVVALGACVLLVVGVDVKSTQVVTVPIGTGMFLFWGGVAASTLASMMVLRERPEPLRLKPHLPPPPDAIHPPPVDVSEILRPSDRPSALVLAGAPGIGPPTADGVEQIRASHSQLAAHYGEAQIQPHHPHPLPGLAPAPFPPAMTPMPAPMPPVMQHSIPTPMPSSPQAVSGELVTKSPEGPRTAVIAAVPPPPRAKPVTILPPTDAAGRPKRTTSDPVMIRPPIFEPRVDPSADTVPAPPPSQTPAAFARTQLAVGRATPPGRIDPQIQPQLQPPIDPIDTERDPSRSKPLQTPLAPPPVARPSRPKVPMPGRTIPPTAPPGGKPRPFGGERPVGTPPSIDQGGEGGPTVTSPPPIIDPLPVPDTRKPQRIVTDVEDALENSVRPTDSITAVEVDAEAKAHAVAAVDADMRQRELEARRALDGRSSAATGSAPEWERGGIDDAAAEEISLGSAVIVELDTDQQAALRADAAARAGLESGDEDLPPTRMAAATRLPRAGSEGPTMHRPTSRPVAPPVVATEPEDAHVRPTRIAHAVVLPPQARRDEEDVKPTAISPAVILPPKPESAEQNDDLKPTAIAPAVRLPPREELAPTRAIPPVRPSPIPMSTAPTTLPPPRSTPKMPAGPTPACPQCEAPMAWVEEHLRFYCKQCRMYF